MLFSFLFSFFTKSYQRLRVGGIPDSNIISMQYGDVANDTQNTYPGSLYNKATGAFKGNDVAKGFAKTFVGTDVNRNNFLGALLCNSSMLSSDAARTSTKCLDSTAEDDVFLFWAG